MSITIIILGYSNSKKHIYFEENFDKLPKDWLSKIDFDSKNRIICDYISGMTDRYALNLYKSVYE